MTQFVTTKDGLRIAYDVAGEGAPIVLIHGFGSSRAQNWKNVGWYETLSAAGRRVIALDCRGHGESDKPHDPSFYGDKMRGDVLAVMDAQGVERADVMGYSMGGFLTIGLVMANPERVIRAVPAGIGATYFNDTNAQRRFIVQGLRAPDPSKLTDPTQRMFRAFASQPGKDLAALTACMSIDRTMHTKEELARATLPVLVVAGDKDTQSGRPEPLAAAFPNGRAALVPGRDHMTAVGDKVYKDAVVQFLAS